MCSSCKYIFYQLPWCFTCCMVTCGWEAMCCCGLRTPAAYLYWGMVRTGAVVDEAPAGRWLRAWVAEVRKLKVSHHQKLINQWSMIVSAEILTHSLGRHHARDLGVGVGGGTDGIESLGPGRWWAYGIGHVLKVWWKNKHYRSIVLLRLSGSTNCSFIPYNRN